MYSYFMPYSCAAILYCKLCLDKQTVLRRDFIYNSGTVLEVGVSGAKPYFNVGLNRPASETPFKMIASIVVS